MGSLRERLVDIMRIGVERVRNSYKCVMDGSLSGREVQMMELASLEDVDTNVWIERLNCVVLCKRW